MVHVKMLFNKTIISILLIYCNEKMVIILKIMSWIDLKKVNRLRLLTLIQFLSRYKLEIKKNFFFY